MDKKKILIVDDEAMIRQLIVDKLTKDGHDAVSVPSPLTAIQLLSKENGGFDLIITDFKMPEMDGLDFVRAVKGKFPDMPIIVISGYGTDEQISAFLKYGAYDFLAKPFALKDLAASIENLFTKRLAMEANKTNQVEPSGLTANLETQILDSRPKIIRAIKLTDELIEESISRMHKQKLQQIHDNILDVSSVLIDISEHLKNN